VLIRFFEDELVYDYLLTCSGGRLYSATVADFSSRDPLIYSRPLRTEQYDSQWLNGQLTVFCIISCWVAINNASDYWANGLYQTHKLKGKGTA